MSTSLLYHAWGLRGDCPQASDFEQGAIVFRIRHLCSDSESDTRQAMPRSESRPSK